MSETLDDIKPLLFRAEPYGDESLPGYVLRLTDLNDYQTPAWVLALAKIKDYDLNRFSSYYLKPDADLSGLARLSGTREETLKELQYRPTGIIKSRLAGDYDVFGNYLPLYTIRTHSPKVCPLCLVDQPYARKLWEMALVTACPVHNCLLLDKCPSCGKPPSWMRRRICECKCGADWRKVEPTMLPLHELVVSRNFYRLCHMPCSVASPSGDGANNRLLELDLRSFVRALMFVSSQFNGKVDTLGKCFAAKLNNVHLHELLLKGFHVFDDFPHGFYRFLDWRKDSPSRRDDRERRSEAGWVKYFDGYKSALFRQMVGSEFDFLRDAFNEYIRHFNYETALALATNLPDGVADLKSLRARIGDLPEDAMSLNQAAQALRVTQPTIDKWIASGVLEAAVGLRKSTGRNRLFLISRRSVERLKARLDSTVTLREASARLGLYVDQGKELIVGSVLKPVRGRSIDNNRRWHVAERDIQCLIEEVISRASLRPAKKAGLSGEKAQTIYDFRLTLSLLRQAGFGLCDLVELIKTDRLRTYRKGRRFSFSALEFEATDLLTFLAPAYAETYSFKQTATLLGVSQWKVKGFIESGVLKTRLLPKLKSAGLRIHKDDIQVFRDTYVTSDEIRRSARVTLEGVESHLETRGIKPIWLHGDTWRMCVLRRSLIAGRDLRREVPRKTMVHVRGIMSPTEAARAIGVTLDELNELVDDGLLKPYSYRSNSRADAAKREVLFSKHSVEKFLRQRDELHGLISIVAAARLLGYRTPNNFLLNEVRRGLIKPIKKTDGKRRNLYFDRAEIEGLAAKRAYQKAICKDKAYVDTKNAAEILGVNVSAIHKMIHAGIIRPEQGWRSDGVTLNLYRRTDVQRIAAERAAFKAERLKQGKSTRYGHLAHLRLKSKARANR